MNPSALRHSSQLHGLRAGRALPQLVLITAMVSLVTACTQMPVGDPSPTPPPIPETAEGSHSTVSIRDAEGTPIPESDPTPAPTPVAASTTTSSTSSATANDFICVPANEAKTRTTLHPKPARKSRAIVHEPVEKKEDVKTSTATPPPGSKLDNVRAIEPGEVMSLLGKKVWGPTGDDMGRVVDLLVEPSGQIRAAVIDFGGFLGVGNRKIAVNWNLLKLHSGSEGKQVVMTLDRDQVLAAPEYKDPAHPAEVVAPSVKHGG